MITSAKSGHRSALGALNSAGAQGADSRGKANSTSPVSSSSTSEALLLLFLKLFSSTGPFSSAHLYGWVFSDKKQNSFSLRLVPLFKYFFIFPFSLTAKLLIKMVFTSFTSLPFHSLWSPCLSSLWLSGNSYLESIKNLPSHQGVWPFLSVHSSWPVWNMWYCWKSDNILRV